MARPPGDRRRDNDHGALGEPLDGIDDGPVHLAIGDEPEDAGDVRVFHKTVDRSLDESRRSCHPEADDVVLVNGAGEGTETVRANLAFLLGGHRWTPPPSVRFADGWSPT